MSGLPLITCRELVEFLDDYVAVALPPDRAHEFERHLAVCPPCVTYLASYRATIALARTLGRTDDAVPPEVPEDLVQAVLAARHRA